VRCQGMAYDEYIPQQIGFQNVPFKGNGTEISPRGI
jgi:hypothetical protein